MKNLELFKLIVGGFAIMVLTKVPLGIWSVASSPAGTYIPSGSIEIKAPALVLSGVIIILMMFKTKGRRTWLKK